MDVVTVRYDAPAISLTEAVERRQLPVGIDRIDISTPPSPDGIIQRMSVRRRVDGSKSHWALVGLANKGDERIERLLVAPCDEPERFNLMPRAPCPSRVIAVTPSRGPVPERVRSDAGGDIFSLALDPQSVMTLVIELATDRETPLYLWDREAYRRHEQGGASLPHRIALGAAALLAAILVLLSWTIWRRRQRAS